MAIKISVEILEKLRHQYENQHTKIVISGNIGPRGDGYNPDNVMAITEAEEYFTLPFSTFKETAVDMVSILTVIRKEEAAGVVKAAKNFSLPIGISFTVETNGGLRAGESLVDAISFVDQVTDKYPSYYMINCAHPTHFIDILRQMPSDVKSRKRGIRANSSKKSHDESTELDIRNIQELGKLHISLMKDLELCVVGGCCGTDARHIKEIGEKTERVFTL